MRKIVVGMSGSKAPISPSATNTNPSASQAARDRCPSGPIGNGSGECGIDQGMYADKRSFGAGNHTCILLRRQIERIERRGEFPPVLRAPVGMPGKMTRSEARVEANRRRRFVE